MALTTDNVRPAPMPNAWRIGSLTMAGIVMAVCLLAFCSSVLLVGKFELGLGIDALRPLAFIALVFGTQATIYAIRQRRHLWGSLPEPLARRVVRNCYSASVLSIEAIAMAPLPAWIVAGTFAAAAGFAVVADTVKVHQLPAERAPATFGLSNRPPGVKLLQTIYHTGDHRAYVNNRHSDYRGRRGDLVLGHR